MPQTTNKIISKFPVDKKSLTKLIYNYQQKYTIHNYNLIRVPQVIILITILHLQGVLYSQNTPTIISIDSNFIDQVDALLLLKNTQDWSDSLEKGKGYDDKNIKIYKVAHSTIKDLYVMSRHFYMDPEDIKHKAIYFGYITDVSEPLIESVNKKNKISIYSHRKLLNDDIETLNTHQCFDDSQLLENIIKLYPLEHCMQETERGFEFLYNFTAKKIDRFRKKKFKKYKLTELIFRTSALKIQYFKIERMMNKKPYTVAIEITITPLST